MIGRSKRERGSGQALVEFSVVLIPFLFLLMGVIDIGRGIYMYNGVSQAARELARTTSVHPCAADPCVLGTSAQTAQTLATQRGLVPGLAAPSATVTYACTTITNTPVAGSCKGEFVAVQVTVPFTAITPLLSMVAPATLSSTSHVEIP